MKNCYNFSRYIVSNLSFGKMMVLNGLQSQFSTEALQFYLLRECQSTWLYDSCMIWIISAIILHFFLILLISNPIYKIRLILVSRLFLLRKSELHFFSEITILITLNLNRPYIWKIEYTYSHVLKIQKAIKKESTAVQRKLKLEKAEN